MILHMAFTRTSSNPPSHISASRPFSDAEVSLLICIITNHITPLPNIPSYHICGSSQVAAPLPSRSFSLHPSFHTVATHILFGYHLYTLPHIRPNHAVLTSVQPSRHVHMGHLHHCSTCQSQQPGLRRPGGTRRLLHIQPISSPPKRSDDTERADWSADDLRDHRPRHSELHVYRRRLG